jgi:ATP-dependent Lhr-like helicase
VRDAEELHDALLTLITLPPTPEWRMFYDELAAERRVSTLIFNGSPLWVAAERVDAAHEAYGPGPSVPVIRGWLESTGPTTASELVKTLALPLDSVEAALAALEAEGQILRGRYRYREGEIEWCDRRLLARIHRMTLGRLRREIDPVSSADFMRFLFSWQHVTPGTQLHGVDGTLQILRQLQGYEISAAAWESDILPKRVARYSSELLDRLCLSGEAMWGRLSPRNAFSADSDARNVRRARPTRSAPVTIFLREDAPWIIEPNGRAEELAALSHAAREVIETLQRRGASFFRELVQSTGRLPSEVEDGVWELAATGWITADGFDNLRALVDPKRRRGEGREKLSRPRHAAGRWALLDRTGAGVSADARNEAFARQLLARWGVVFRDLLARETLAPAWRDLLVALRRMEARGEIRGGRFVSGFVGEQFAKPEAIDLMRATRRNEAGPAPQHVAAADPLNLSGIITPGPRVSPLTVAMVAV